MQTLTKVYEDPNVARQVVTELEAAEIPSSAISIVENKGADIQYDDGGATAGGGAEAGLMIGGAAGGLLAGLGAMTIPGIGQVAAAGWLVTMALGAFAGGVTGGILGALIDANVPEEHAHVYSEALRRGASLVSVRVENNEVELARAILDRHTSIDPVKQREEYRKSGWKRFDPSVSSDYVPESIEVERMRGPKKHVLFVGLDNNGKGKFIPRADFKRQQKHFCSSALAPGSGSRPVESFSSQIQVA